MAKENVFNNLNHINVNEYTNNKNGLTYLSWAWAWGEVKKEYPSAVYEIKKFGENEKPYLFDEDLGYMVFTEVTIDGLTHEMWLPVMDHSNNSMSNNEQTITKFKREVTVAKATMFDINSALMRCLTKNLAMHGLGLYIYAGEDLPEEPPAKKITESQVKSLQKIIDVIADLTKQDSESAKKVMLKHQNMPDKLEMLDENQYGTFLNYMNNIKMDMEKKTKEVKKKSVKNKVKDEVGIEARQETLLEEHSTQVKGQG